MIKASKVISKRKVVTAKMPELDPEEIAARQLLGSRIKQAREQNTDLSPAEASRALGISRSAWAQWESGKTKPTFRRLRMVSQLVHATTDWLTHGSDVPSTGGMAMNNAPEGELVDIKTLDAVTAATLKAAMTGRPRAEIWQITTDLMTGAGYKPGDYLIVDPDAIPKMGGQNVLAEQNGKPIFRLYAMPALYALPPVGKTFPAVTVDGFQVLVRGLVIRHVGL